MLQLTFSSELDWGSYITSIAKTASKNIGALICSMKFLSPEFAQYLYKSSIQPFMEYCCHVLAGAPSCYLELLDQIQRYKPLAHGRNASSISFFYKYYFDRCSSELAQLFPFPYSRGRSTRFYLTIPRCWKDACVNSFFPRTASLWNSLPIELFPLTYDLNGFKSKINRHLSTSFLGSF